MELKLRLLLKYNDLIRKRYKLKSFLKKFGLLNELMGCSSNRGDSKTQKLPVTFDSADISNEKLLNFELPQKFERFFANGEEYLKFQKLLSYRNSLIQRLSNFQEYRSKGLTSHWQISIYKSLKAKRLSRMNTVHMDSLLNSINRFDQDFNKEKCNEWFKKFVAVEKNLVGERVNASSHFKFKSLPLKIEHYPDSDKLNDEEKEFCRVTRIQPSVYLRVKEILCLESQTHGSCSYSRARKLAKIDVNKTRVIHNFMLKVGLIRAAVSWYRIALFIIYVQLFCYFLK